MANCLKLMIFITLLEKRIKALRPTLRQCYNASGECDRTWTDINELKVIINQ